MPQLMNALFSVLWLIFGAVPTFHAETNTWRERQIFVGMMGSQKSKFVGFYSKGTEAVRSALNKRIVWIEEQSKSGRHNLSNKK